MKLMATSQPAADARNQYGNYPTRHKTQNCIGSCGSNHCRKWLRSRLHTGNPHKVAVTGQGQFEPLTQIQETTDEKW